MLTWIDKNRTILYYCYIGIWIGSLALFGTDLIHCNLQQFIYTHFSIWANLMIVLVQVLILKYLTPRK